MLKAQRYQESSVEAGGGALSFSLAAVWVGINKCILIHFETLPAAGDELIISHQNKNGLAAWKTELFSEDPNLCNTQDFIFTVPVCLQNGDSMEVKYANSDKVGITCSITLEAS